MRLRVDAREEVWKKPRRKEPQRTQGRPPQNVSYRAINVDVRDKLFVRRGRIVARAAPKIIICKSRSNVRNGAQQVYYDDTFREVSAIQR